MNASRAIYGLVHPSLTEYFTVRVCTMEELALLQPAVAAIAPLLVPIRCAVSNGYIYILQTAATRTLLGQETLSVTSIAAGYLMAVASMSIKTPLIQPL